MTSKLLYIFWKIMGLCPFHLTEKGIIKFSYCGVFYSTILSLCYSVCYYKVIINRASYMQPSETLMSTVADMAAITAQFWMIVTTWLRFGYRQNVLARIFLSFKKIIETCKILEIREVRRVSVTSLIIQTVVLNCAWMAMFVSSNLLIWGLHSSQYRVRVPFNIGRLVYPNFIIIFTAAMSVIRDQFRALNNKIQEHSRDDSTKIMIPEVKCRTPLDTSGIESLAESDLLGAYVQVHSELVDLATRLSEFCSLPLYLTMTIHLSELASTVYDICLNVKDQKVWPPQEHGYFIVLNIWLALHVVTMVAMLAVSDSTTKEATRTGNVLHEIVTSNSSANLVGSANVLSLRLLQKPLTIELFGSLRMDFSIVYQICNVITTYVIVMVQLDDQKRERHKIHNRLPEQEIN